MGRRISGGQKRPGVILLNAYSDRVHDFSRPRLLQSFYTMNIKDQVENFQGTKDDLIKALLVQLEKYESQLQLYAVHHSICPITPGGQTLQSTPPVQRGDGRVLSPTQATQPSLKFIINEITTGNRRKRTRPSLKWKGSAQTLVDEVPLGRNWWVKLKDIELDSVSQNQHAISMLCDWKVSSGSTHEGVQKPPYDSAAPNSNCIPGLITYARAYGEQLRKWEQSATFAATMASLSRIIFISICVVILKAGVPEAQINAAMSLVSGQDSPVLHQRHRAAVVWLHGLINSLYSVGWGIRASDLLLMCECRYTHLHAVLTFGRASIGIILSRACRFWKGFFSIPDKSFARWKVPG